MLQSTVVRGERFRAPWVVVAGCIALALAHTHRVRAEPTTNTTSTVNVVSRASLQPKPLTVPIAPSASATSSSGAKPVQWLPSRGRECERGRRHRGFRFCAGPRKAPVPTGAAAELATKLGLGEKKTVSVVLREVAKPEWIAAATPDPVRAQIAPREALARSDAGEPALLWPVAEGKFWRGFGRERVKGKSAKAARAKGGGKSKARGRHHDGIDIGAPEGTPVLAVQDGLVLYADNGVRGYGNLLVTVHADGSVAFYAHFKALYVFPGQLVTRGQVVGEVGQTGYARGSHLHFEYRKDGRLRDPMRFLARPRDPGTS